MELQQTQTQKLSQRQLYGVELLRLGTQELDAYVRELAQENPLIEVEEGQTASAGPAPGRNELLDRLKWLEDNDRQNWFYQQFSDEELDPLARIGTGGGLEETLVSFLTRQLDRLRLDGETRRLVEYLICCLDDDGYLRTPLKELSKGEPLDKLEGALAVLRTLEPAGVGAENLSQCLVLQLERIGERGPALAIAQNHLDALARRHYRAIASALNVTQDQVEQARLIIRELDPRPGAVFQSGGHVQYIQPDLIVEEKEGRLTVRSARGDRPPFRMSRYYRDLLEKSEDREVRDYLTEKLRQAENVLWAAEQRGSTLLRCAQVIVARQEAFFRSGAGGLVPLGMAEVASELELHESTVSRAVREKYLQCARGLYPLSFFFSRRAGTGGGDGPSGRAARALLRRLIEEEDRSAPLSDQKLALRMAQEGCEVSRRTVAKYREELGFPGASGRKSR